MLFPAIFSRLVAAAELAESNQSWVFCQVNNKIRESRPKELKAVCKGVIVSINNGIQMGQGRM